MKLPAHMKAGGMMKGKYVVLLFIVGIMGVVGIIGTFSEIQSKHECHTVAQQYKRHTSYTIFGGGCYVEVEAHVSVQLEQFQAFKRAH